jgi:putative FmdB family regulatory protein
MVLYDYKCSECEDIHEMTAKFEDRELVCPKCGAASRRIVSKTRRCQLDIFQEQEFEGMAEGTGPITSKAHLARECEKQGIYARMLMEGTRNHGRRKEL